MERLEVMPEVRYLFVYMYYAMFGLVVLIVKTTFVYSSDLRNYNARAFYFLCAFNYMKGKKSELEFVSKMKHHSNKAIIKK